MKKRMLSVLIAGAMAFAMCACGSSASDAAAGSANPSADASSSAVVSEAAETATIAVVLKTLNSEYWNAVASGVRQAEIDLGCKVNLNGPPSETSFDEQFNMIETVLNMEETDAVVIAPLQPESTAAAVANTDLPVLAVDSTFESENLLSYVGVSNETASKTMGTYVAEKLNGSGNVIILSGIQGESTTADRLKGFTDGLEEGGCTVLDMQYTDCVADKAVMAMEGLMQQYPGQIDAVVCHSDDVAMGAVNAVENAGLADEIPVYGFGGISGAQPVKDGLLEATVDIGAYEMGYNCVVRALDAVNGETLESFYPTVPTIIDSTNVDAFLATLGK